MAIMLEARDIAAGHHVLLPRLAVPLPDYQSKNDMNPTLLVSWFCTILSLITITIRLLGRWVRNEALFVDDKIMFWSIIPLLGRMAFVHVILIWGTNNTVNNGMTELEIQHRRVGSKLVLPARIFFLTYIWIAKITVLEFLKKLVAQSWHKSYEIGMRIVYGLLALTYVAVVISTLAECRPFSHYWQVVPDPGPACRSTPAQLITMGVCEIVTDLVLIVFPIPLVLMSAMTLKRKVSLVLLFLLSVILIAITAYRVPSTLQRDASQQYRSLLASLEILASTAVANAIVIGSFLRDRGVKKAKFRAGSVDGSMLSRVTTNPLQRSRTKSIAQHHWGSDEDLVRELGLSVRPDLRHGSVTTDAARLAPVAEVLPTHDENVESRPSRPTIDTNWTFSKTQRNAQERSHSIDSSISSSSTDIKLRELRSQMEEPISPGQAYKPRKMSFFETGETLDSPYVSSHAPPDLDTSRSHAFLSDVGGLLGGGPKQDDEISVIPSTDPTDPPKGSLHPRDPRRLLRSSSPFKRATSAEPSEAPNPHRRSRSPVPDIGPDSMNLADAGGLLK